MSERYGSCLRCKGYGSVASANRVRVECGRCGGTGFSGDAMAYLETEQRMDREREGTGQRYHGGMKEHTTALRKADNAFWSKIQDAHALDCAVAAIEAFEIRLAQRIKK